MIKLDVTLRKAEELTAQEEEIERLLGVIKSKEDEVRRMSEYAVLYIQTFDQLKRAKQVLDNAGLDSSWIKLRDS